MGSIIVTAVAVSVILPVETGGLAADVDGFSLAPLGLPTSGSSATVIFSASRASCSKADVEGLDSKQLRLEMLKVFSFSKVLS